MAATDRLGGSEAYLAIKAPCRAIATGNITLAGLQTIDGVALSSGNRVLVNGQTDTTQNGIWIAANGDWVRATDFDGARDAMKGTLVWVDEGTVYGQNYYRLTTSGVIAFGTTPITFAQTPGAGTMGLQGPTGPKGDKGDQGDKGDTGPTGATGPQGEQGNAGPKGDKGDTGAKGDKGNQGDRGNTGLTGPTGPKGDKGLNWRGSWAISTNYAVDDAVMSGGSLYICYGAHSSDSATLPGVGANWAGVWDLAVAKGATGQAGAAGPTGPKGDPGDDGAPGATGAKGMIWRGEWADAETYSADDTVYANSVGGSYICIASHTADSTNRPGEGVDQANFWSQVAIKGDDGNTGPQGDPGAAGPAGFAWQGDWADTTAYDAGDAVRNGDSVYIATVGHTAAPETEPGVGASFDTVWDVFVSDGAGAVGALLAANNLSDLDDAEAARSSLGLTIGINVQAFDPMLDAIASNFGPTWAADLVLLTTTNGMSYSTFSALAQTLNANSLASGMRSTLGLVIGTDVQAYDPELSAFAGLTSAANKIGYFTGSGTMSTTDFTAYGRSLVGVADEAAFKALVNLEAGVDFQAYDAELAAFAGLASAANKIGYFTGSGTMGLADFTAYGRSIVAVADEAAFKALVNLEAGTDYQAYDADLAAFAGLTSAANKLAYFTGAGTMALADFTAGGRALVNSAGTADTFPYFSASNTVTLGSLTASGRALLDDADAAAQRATLQLVIGTNVQAYDAELAAFAGLVSAANKIPMFTGSGTAGLIDFKDEDDMSSNSATAVPSQQSVKAYVDANGGGLISATEYTSDGTFDVAAAIAAGGTYAYVRAGAGGGSGARAASGSSGSGGGGGACVEGWFKLTDLLSSETITIGAGGAAVTGASTVGNDGGNTTFGSKLTAYGGGGGRLSGAESVGGGGGGLLSKGNAAAVGRGGGAAGGAPGSSSSIAGSDSSFGGGGGGFFATPTSAGNKGGDSIYGGGGGSGGYNGSGSTAAQGGGKSVYGGGGGNGAATTTAIPACAPGSSVFGGQGGQGGFDTTAATDGGASSKGYGGGGGGGSEAANSGAGGKGSLLVLVF